MIAQRDIVYDSRPSLSLINATIKNGGRFKRGEEKRGSPPHCTGEVNKKAKNVRRRSVVRIIFDMGVARYSVQGVSTRKKKLVSLRAYSTFLSKKNEKREGGNNRKNGENHPLGDPRQKKKKRPTKEGEKKERSEKTHSAREMVEGFK